MAPALIGSDAAREALSSASSSSALPQQVQAAAPAPPAPAASSAAPLDSARLSLQLNPNPAKPNFENLTWGQRFTPHMLCIPWNQVEGWGTPVIKPYGDLSISPAAPVLQYASTCFEGMKAYRCSDGHVRLFRPEMNMARMNRSAARASLPTFQGEEMIKLIKKLIQIDIDHVPHLMGESLYLRPTLIGTPDTLGMGTPSEALLYCICNPVGSYFGVGATINPVSLLAVSKSIRAWPGGTGSYKLGANYVGATLLASQAQLKGHSQVLWLFGDDPELTEVGAMNLFVVFKKGNHTTICTPSLLDGTILPGVTRDSVLSLVRDYTSDAIALEGLPDYRTIEVQERRITMREVLEASDKGELIEVFGSGTAACICPVRSISIDDEKSIVPRDAHGAFAKELYRQITSRQWGLIPDDQWTVTCA